MTHAEHIDRGYPEVYGVSDVYENEPGLYRVDIYDWSMPTDKQIIDFREFETLEEAEAYQGAREIEIADWEVEEDTEDPVMEYQAKAMEEVAK